MLDKSAEKISYQENILLKKKHTLEHHRIFGQFQDLLHKRHGEVVRARAADETVK